MNPRFFCALMVTGLVTFAAGVWCAPWLQKTKAANLAADKPDGPRPPAGIVRAGAGALVLDPAQGKADARLAAESPQKFLDSLSGESGLKVQARIAAAIAEMSLGQVRELAKQADAMSFGGGPNQWQFTWAVFERWGELDADGLLVEARLSPNRPMGYTGVTTAFRHLTRHDSAGAWKKAQDMGPQTYYAKQAVLQTIGESDPAGALQLALNDSVSRRDAWSISSVMQSWLARDREAALQSLDTVPSGEFRSNLIWQMGHTMAAIDPQAALEWGRQLINPAERRQVLHEAVGVMASRDPMAALAMLDNPEFASQRRDGLGVAVGAWARRDFDAALGYALSSKSPADQQQMLAVLSEGATSTERARLLEEAKNLPPSASKSIYQAALNGSYYGTGLKPLEIIDQVKSTSVREELIKNQINNGWSNSTDDIKELFARLQPTSQTTQQAGQIASRMAWTDPAEALKWAGTLESVDLKNAALKSALQHWAGSDPRAAVGQINLISDLAQRTEALRQIAATWAGNDDGAALAWAQTLSGADRSAALGALVRNSLQASPEKAQELYATFAASLDPDGAATAENKGVARSMAATLTENDPREAIVWAGALVPGGAQDEAVAGIAEKWAGYDPASASEWIGTLPAGEGRDLAAGKLVAAIARDDPDSAWAWATSIQDATQRREAAASVLSAWKGYGRTAEARTALALAGFSADDRKELAKRLE